MKLDKLFKNQEYISYLIVLFYSLIFFFFIQDPFENIFVNYDQEFWNTYNSLLIYSGLEQEKFDEPGHINYLLFATYLKLINLFQIINVPTIDILNQSNNVSEIFQDLVFHSRLFGLIINFVLTIFIIKIFLKFHPKNLILITLILLTSNGFLTHISQYRVEPMTLLLFLIATYILIDLIKSKEKIFLRLFFFNFFLILSIINKVQIIFYIPFFLLILLNFQKYNFFLLTNLMKLISNRKNLSYFLVSALLIIFAILIRSEQIHSTIYLTSMYLILLLSFYSLKDVGYNEKIFYLFNISLLLAFIIIYYFVINISFGGKNTFWVFFKISKIRGYLGSLELDQKHDTILWIKDFVYFSLYNLKKLFFEIIRFNSNNLIVFFVFFITILSGKFKKYFNLNIFIIIYLITKFITTFRANHFYYEIYFDWIILLGLIIFLNNFKTESHFKNLFLILIIFINIINNFNTSNLTLINSGSYKKDIYCSKDQIYSEMGIWTYYSKRIEKKQILEICKIEN